MQGHARANAGCAPAIASQRVSRFALALVAVCGLAGCSTNTGSFDVDESPQAKWNNLMALVEFKPLPKQPKPTDPIVCPEIADPRRHFRRSHLCARRRAIERDRTLSILDRRRSPRLPRHRRTSRLEGRRRRQDPAGTRRKPRRLSRADSRRDHQRQRREPSRQQALSGPDQRRRRPNRSPVHPCDRPPQRA